MRELSTRGCVYRIIMERSRTTLICASFILNKLTGYSTEEAALLWNEYFINIQTYGGCLEKYKEITKPPTFYN